MIVKDGVALGGMPDNDKAHKQFERGRANHSLVKEAK